MVLTDEICKEFVHLLDLSLKKMLDQQLQAFFHSSSFLKTLQTEVTIVVVVVVDKTNKNSIAVKYSLPLNAVTMNVINHLV